MEPLTTGETQRRLRIISDIWTGVVALPTPPKPRMRRQTKKTTPKRSATSPTPFIHIATRRRASLRWIAMGLFVVRQIDAATFFRLTTSRVLRHLRHCIFPIEYIWNLGLRLCFAKKLPRFSRKTMSFCVGFALETNFCSVWNYFEGLRLSGVSSFYWQLE